MSRNRYITYELGEDNVIVYDDAFMGDLLKQELTGDRDPRNSIGLACGVNPADALELAYHRDQLIEWEPQHA